MFIQRANGENILDAIRHFPVTAVIGPRQCGKSTLAKHLMKDYPSGTFYLDLERPSDLEKLRDAEWFLSSQKDKLICIDEIQRKPELFPLIRSLVAVSLEVYWQQSIRFLLHGLIVSSPHL